MSDADHKLEVLKALIAEKYDPEANGQNYWETGNFDDTFEMGEASGYADALLDVGRMLGMDLPDKVEVEV